MDFARKQLEKYGWKEGKGLGKSEDGIANAIKPKLKFDNSGVGHDVGAQFTNNWWEKLYNSAAENLDIQVDNNQIKMGVKDSESVEISTKSYSVQQLKKDTNLEYGSFIKTAKLTENGVENVDVKPLVIKESKTYTPLSDQELFEACGGRTAHKGARHGLKLSGKLSRIEKQEKMLLKQMKKVSISENNEKVEKKLKKVKRQKQQTCQKYTPFSEEDIAGTSTSPMKKKNKKRKAVSFNENVTTYTIDLDTSFDSELSSLRDENSNDTAAQENLVCPDEGIEHDLENNNNNIQDNHRAFEEARLSFSDLSKAERKKLKKKRKLAAKLNTPTNLFLKKLDVNIDECMEEDKDLVSKKRKYLEIATAESKTAHSETEAPERNRSKRNKKKRNKQRKLEEKQVNSIVKSLDSFCRISDCE